MGISIGEVTQGYSRTGATDYLTQLNAKAITETKQLVGQIDDIRSTFEQGWQGQAQINFMSNLQKACTAVQSSLDEIKLTLDSQFATIEEVWAKQDSEMVPLD